ncbi:hypothetical protein Nepgr_012291 [Nepenthes gracilis]|uniref:Kinesin-like protein n=1 Tax=Nepenthes gracilis TaxID=150966 RepID=A0AAD3SGP0_NEPGR|nr:hypothetical protein Nepgr_012291 [Nepenthes gracilis]
MSNFLVCARFRPLSSREKRNHGANVCIRRIDDGTFIFKDEKDGDLAFSFDRVFYEESDQANIFEFLALPIVHDAVNGINGTIITYGQTGAGKTYSLEGPSILDCDEQKKGLLPRVVEEIFRIIKPSLEATASLVKLSMVEIYMEKVRDLFDLSKDNIQIKESKLEGILLNGVTEQELPVDKRIKSGKLILVDLAGSEKVEKTGAEGRVLEEAKAINKSLSALGNVINTLTCSSQGKGNHIPYRDSKLTRILQDALVGAKHIKASLHNCSEDENSRKQKIMLQNKDESYDRIIDKLREKLSLEEVELLEELLILEGIIFYPNSVEDLESAYEDVISRTISSLHQAVEELVFTVEKLKRENNVLKSRLTAAETTNQLGRNSGGNARLWDKISGALGYPNHGGSLSSSNPAVFNFGDSNSDTGGLTAGIGFSLPPPYGQTYFHKPSGRFSDGRLIIDFLVNAAELPFLKAYLDSVGAPSFRRGCNYAAAGATILPATAASVCPFSFGIQVNQFSRFKARVLELLSQSKANGTYLPVEDYFSKGLYMFDIGQNDLAGAFYSKTLDQVLALIPTVLTEFESGIKRLYEEGARHFWIHNTGPLGCLAQNIAKFGGDPSTLDEHGCVRGHNQAAMSFNLHLHTFCEKLQSQYVGAVVTYVDIYAIKSNLIANYSHFGFEQPILVCCGFGGAPLNYDSRVGCGRTAVVNGSAASAKACMDSSKYVNWDGIHYTDAANRFVASQILAGKYCQLRLI